MHNKKTGYKIAMELSEQWKRIKAPFSRGKNETLLHENFGKARVVFNPMNRGFIFTVEPEAVFNITADGYIREKNNFIRVGHYQRDTAAGMALGQLAFRAQINHLVAQPYKNIPGEYKLRHYISVSNKSLEHNGPQKPERTLFQVRAIEDPSIVNPDEAAVTRTVFDDTRMFAMGALIMGSDLSESMGQKSRADQWHFAIKKLPEDASLYKAMAHIPVGQELNGQRLPEWTPT